MISIIETICGVISATEFAARFATEECCRALDRSPLGRQARLRPCHSTRVWTERAGSYSSARTADIRQAHVRHVAGEDAQAVAAPPTISSPTLQFGWN